MLGAFLLFLGLVIIAQLGVRIGSKDRNSRINRFFDNERRANAARKAPIPEHLFITPDTSGLPVKDFAGAECALALAQRKALECARKRMIYFSNPMSNQEIKLTYGAMQLERIADYEEGFNAYHQALIVWAECLVEENMMDDALAIIKHSIEYNSPIPKCYSMFERLQSNTKP